MLKAIMPAKDIPVGKRVTKITGTKVYVIRDSITIYGPTGKANVIRADKGTRFLLPPGDSFDNISSIRGTKELAVELDRDDLINMIESGEAQ
jgi:hypothetical protein